MKQRLDITQYHSEEELLTFEKMTKYSKIHKKICAIRLLSFCPNMSKNEICSIIGFGRTTLLEWAHKYNKDGLDGLFAKHQNAGRKSHSSIIGHDKIRKRLETPPDDVGLWTGKKLRLWMENELGVKIAHDQGCKVLHRLGYSLQRPRPSNPKADKERQLAFKK